MVIVSTVNETPGVSGFSPLTKVALALWPVPLMASCLHLVEKIGGSRYYDLDERDQTPKAGKEARWLQMGRMGD